MKSYVKEILKEAGYGKEKTEDISKKIVEGFHTHGDVINLDIAQKIGLNAVGYERYQPLWDTFREWLGKYLLKSANKHIIRYWISNSKKGKNVRKKGKKRKK